MICRLMFRLWLLTMILVIRFTRDLLRSIQHFILILNFTRPSCNTKTPTNLEGVREKINEAEEAEDVEINEVVDKEVGITIMETTTIMAAVDIKINIITMILININESLL